MNVANWLICGLLATAVMTIILSGSQQLGLTRMNMPYILGTLFTADRDRAKSFGFAMHFFNGWAFSFAYGLLFHGWGHAGWWRGLILGVLHGVGVLVIGMQVLPGLHPRMAGEHRGPTVTRQLEPPGFLGLHYGLRTPLFVMLGHAVFGLLLGALYRL